MWEFFVSLKIKDKISIGLVFIALIFILFQKIFFGEAEVVDNREKIELKIGEAVVKVEVAKTEEEKYKGLSFRDNLNENEGMLFEHKRVGVHEYAMRDMLFDLDFVFIRDKEVVDIIKKASKDFKGAVKGATTYDKVLEVPAGWVDRKGIGLGDVVEIDN
jgi:uncharacterized membrane protein (UPF0127 family)